MPRGIMAKIHKRALKRQEGGSGGGWCGRCWPAFWVVAIGFGRYVVSVGIDRSGAFRTVLVAFGCNLGRDGQFWLLRTQASGRSGPEFHKKYRKCIKFFAKS